MPQTAETGRHHNVRIKTKSTNKTVRWRNQTIQSCKYQLPPRTDCACRLQWLREKHIDQAYTQSLHPKQHPCYLIWQLQWRRKPDSKQTLAWAWRYGLFGINLRSFRRRDDQRQPRLFVLKTSELHPYRENWQQTAQACCAFYDSRSERNACTRHTRNPPRWSWLWLQHRQCSWNQRPICFNP